jgi:hypothetical protein
MYILKSYTSRLSICTGIGLGVEFQFVSAGLVGHAYHLAGVSIFTLYICSMVAIPDDMYVMNPNFIHYVSVY